MRRAEPARREEHDGTIARDFPLGTRGAEEVEVFAVVVGKGAGRVFDEEARLPHGGLTARVGEGAEVGVARDPPVHRRVVARGTALDQFMGTMVVPPPASVAESHGPNCDEPTELPWKVLEEGLPKFWLHAVGTGPITLPVVSV